MSGGLRALLLEYHDFVQGELMDELEKQADILVRDMKRVEETSSEGSHGVLNASIRKEPRDEKSLYVKAGGPTTTKTSANGKAYDHALAKEFGTRHQKAEPFFFPTYQRWKPGARKRLIARLRRAEETWGTAGGWLRGIKGLR